jgi:hypothetical protein
MFIPRREVRPRFSEYFGEPKRANLNDKGWQTPDSNMAYFPLNKSLKGHLKSPLNF